MHNRFNAYSLVVLQFSAIGWLVIAAYPFQLNLLALLLCAFGIILGAWAIWVMRVSKIRILPIPHMEADLVTNGPYRSIRHPMYTAVLLFTSGLIVVNFYWINLLIWVGLCTVLIIKLNWEEKMLAEKFPQYVAYSEKSFKLIPFIY
jgi:protein-S-isoprenylcysteine O-methyltransferase Ste14